MLRWWCVPQFFLSMHGVIKYSHKVCVLAMWINSRLWDFGTSCHPWKERASRLTQRAVLGKIERKRGGGANGRQTRPSSGWMESASLPACWIVVGFCQITTITITFPKGQAGGLKKTSKCILLIVILLPIRFSLGDADFVIRAFHRRRGKKEGGNSSELFPKNRSHGGFVD